MVRLIRNGVLFCGCIALVAHSSTAEEISAPQTERVTASFREGVNGYQGTVDVEIWALAPTTILADNPNASSDADNDGGESQVLLRFDRIIGVDQQQVPPNAVVHSARLLLSAFDQGSTVNLHRMAGRTRPHCREHVPPAGRKRRCIEARHRA